MKRIGLSIQAGFAVAAVLLTGPVGATAAPNLDVDPNVARLMAPCYRALHAEEAARPQVYARSPRLTKVHQDIIDALQVNRLCSPTLKPMSSMRLANDAFLWSLLAQTEQLLGSPRWRQSIHTADGLLSQCVVSPELIRQRVSSRCQNQRSFNIAFEREPAGNDPCSAALKAENTAGDELSGTTIDPVRTAAAYKATNDGLAADAHCQSPPMRLVGDGYLYSLKAEAEHDLDIPGWDKDFGLADDLLTRCATTLRGMPNNVAQNCGAQRMANEALAKEYRDEASTVTQAGPTSPDAYTVMPWPYPVRADFNPTTLPATDPFATTVDYDTFAAVGSVDDLRTMFDFGTAGVPPAITVDFFRHNMLLFAISRKPNQQCTSAVQDVHTFTPAGAVSTAGTTTTLPVVVVDYALACQPPPSPTSPVTLALQVGRSGGQVQFIENGGRHRRHYYVPAPPHR